MDNQRLFLVIALVFILFLIWNAWMQEQVPQRPPAPVAEQTDRPTEPGMDAEGVPRLADVPDTFTEPEAREPFATEPDAQRIRITTDQLNAEIDLQGGTLVRVGLLNYPLSQDEPDRPFPLMEDRGGRMFLAQSGLLASEGVAPDHHQLFQAEQTEFVLQPGQDKLEVPMYWEDESGIRVTKTYTFYRDSFVIDVDHRVDNASEALWRGTQYRQLQRRPPPGGRQFGIYTYTGGVISTPDKNYDKISFSNMSDRDLNIQSIGGWVAMIQHYFLGAWIPDQDEVNNFYTQALSAERYVLGMIGLEQQVAAPGESTTFASRLYVGPKIQERLEPLAPYLARTVDYGWLWFIAEPLFWLLNKIHGFVGNWGWSIIILTIMIKLVFYKLSETSYRSMANMRKVAPKLQQIKERYGDDKQKLNQAMMELYKKEKINPLGGCLPIVVQIPVFIALYWMLLESVELRHAPWMLWIQDLSTRDPYFILPLIMGASMFIQMKLNPPPPDPLQAKIMMALPFVFTIFFLWFPAGLVLYWVVNNVLSIAQQYVITKRVEAAAAKT